MNDGRKKTLALLLAAAMLFGMLPAALANAEGAEETARSTAEITLAQGATTPVSSSGAVIINAANFPDPAFRQWVENNISNTGGVISAATVAATASINCSGTWNIADLTGIALFPALTELDCSYNRLTALDVSGNPALVGLSCYWNQLTVLDVSGNPALGILGCGKNQLTALDVSGNPALTALSCGSNQLTALDVSGNPALTDLSCGSNQLTALDVGGNPALETLSCGSNQLTALDVSGNPALTELNCIDNQLTVLDVSGNPALEYLDCHDNRLTALDMSGNPALEYLDCQNNRLTALDLSRNHKLMDASISPQSNALAVSGKSGAWTVDLSALRSAGMVYSKVTLTTPNAALYTTTGLVTVAQRAVPAALQYTYNTDNTAAGSMAVTVKLTRASHHEPVTDVGEWAEDQLTGASAPLLVELVSVPDVPATGGAPLGGMLWLLCACVLCSIRRRYAH